MIKSMTAYAELEKSVEDTVIKVEVRTYNSRHLDIQLRMTQGYRILEDRIKSQISNAIDRGRVDIRIQINDVSEEAVAYEVDQPKAMAYSKAVESLKSMLGLTGDMPLDLLVSRNDLIRPKENELNAEDSWGVLGDCLKEVLTSLDNMRQKEGVFMAEDFRKRLQFIQESIDKIEDESSGLMAHYKQKLMDRISILTEDRIVLDQGRIEQEAAFLADKSDISEEITRLRSHLSQFDAFMSADAPCGHKLNFLLQEINREINTIGSKAGQIDVSHMVVNVKSELEKIREQVQNVE